MRERKNSIIERCKDWIRNNKRIARREPQECDFFEIEVFGYNHEQVANDLNEALEKSGFLDKYPLFKIRIDPMQ